MACHGNNNTPTTQTITTQTTDTAYLHDAVAKIDQLQKEATLQSLCEGCDSTLMTQIYNTKPVSFYLCNGTLFTANIPQTTNTTTVFRIEELRKNAVVLRLIDTTTDPYTCTNYTVIFELGCACCMQCFAPICCDKCTGACPNNNPALVN